MATQAGKLIRGGQLPRQFVSFAALGVLGTGAHYLTLALLLRAGWPATLATAVGALAGALLNYRLNYRYTFRSRQPQRLAASRFLAIAALGWLLNAGVFHLLHQRGGWSLWPAQIVSTLLVLVSNFAGNRCWTFGGDLGEKNDR